MSYKAMEKLYNWLCSMCSDDYPTRNCETSSLQVKHIVLNPEPQCGATPFDSKNITFKLVGWKGWQRKIGKGEHQLNGYFYQMYFSL
ncbi:hypothetical protein Moror_15406 [Moniliophthora roreri MCA 2997]|uniref:Uncharacterized protein n=1 Tax=Moniliophthora roreri (strain MCA 2997) TaxID=1381753 RepID=V2WN19_MONRO|nr:hypothetical protein Moror_15406 [Moniliophthora roreri MCA 2997]